MIRYIRNVSKIRYEKSLCKGCGRCVEVCPHGAFTFKNKRAELADKDACMECGACMKNCAFNAIQVETGVGCAAALIGSYLPGNKGRVCC